MRNSGVKKIGWGRVRSVSLCVISIFLAICLLIASVLVIKDATMSTRERTKLRLMYRIEHNGWDPFSADMTLEEYFALMELYDDGKLPLKNRTTAYAAEEDDEEENNGGNGDISSGGPATRLYFPREKFLLSGLDLTGYVGQTPHPLLYNSDNRYGPHDPNTFAKTTVSGTTYTTNNLVRYNDLSATFAKIPSDGKEYEVNDGLLCEKGTNVEYVVDEDEPDPKFVLTELPNTNDESKVGDTFVLHNGVLYREDSWVGEPENRYTKIYTPKYYELELEGTTSYYALHTEHAHEGLAERDRLYNLRYEEQIVGLYEHAFRLEKNGTVSNEIYVRHHDDDGDCDLYLHSLNGDRFTPNKGDVLISLSTEYRYVSDGSNGLFRYNDEAKDNAGEVFKEDAGDYYILVIPGNEEGATAYQLTEWRKGELFIPGTNSPYGNESKNIIKELAYYYPEGLSMYGQTYMRPSHSWLGLLITPDTAGSEVRRVQIVQEKENTGRIAGYVRQDLFRGTPILDANGKETGEYQNDGIQYDKYYIKQVTLGGANVNILGVIWAEDLGKYVYYYLSAEGQSTQVSTTTLGDDQKFVIEYVPYEYEVSFQVRSGNADVSLSVPKDVVMFGSNEPTEANWVDSIFGANRPSRTVDGAYSFDVLVPFGYEVQILIQVTRTIEGGTFIDANGRTRPNIAKYSEDEIKSGKADREGAIPYTFDAEIDHTSSRSAVRNTWLAAYGQYLLDNGIITGIGRLQNADGTVNEANLNEFKKKINETQTKNADGTVTYTFSWADPNDSNRRIHNNVLEIIAERVNDIRMHNSALNLPETGFPLGRFPTYNVTNDSKQLPASTGPAALTFKDTFYNHYVKADRVITAVLKPIGALTFDLSRVLTTNNAKNRGSVATAEWAYAPEETLKTYYELAVQGIKVGLPLESGSAPDNVKSYDSWDWNNGNSQFSKGPVPMTNPSNAFYNPEGRNKDGSYNYNFMFQTNSGDSYYMDVLEINGVAMQLPLAPRYVSKVTGYRGIQADDSHPWYTTGTLPDGAKVTIEFWYGWRSSREQHHYRIRIEGVRTNVAISGLNLMQYDNGAPEHVVYNLVGVYSDLNGESQQSEAIEYFGKPDQDSSEADTWHRSAESTMYVKVLSGGGDTGNYGANLRFKVADGYGTPYFIWNTLRNGVAYTSLPTKNGVLDTTKPNDVINFSAMKAGEGFAPDRIYYDDRAKIGENANPGYKYYYIRIPGNDLYGGDKMALLTIVARTVKYTVRYVPYVAGVNGEHTLEGSPWSEKEEVTLYNYPVSGYVIHPDSGKLVAMTDTLLKDLGTTEKAKTFLLSGTSMPLMKHNWDSCALADTLRDENGNLPGVGDNNYQFLQILHEFDDNDGDYYDLLTHTVATVANDANGIIRPRDTTDQFAFVSWVVVGSNYEVLSDEHGNPIYFSSGAIDMRLYSNYAVKHSAFGNDDMDIHVLRLMPVWRANRDTTTYRVVLNWVDALGELHAQDYSGLWDDIVTEKPDGDLLYVFLNQGATALQNWIAQHPTYTFWDAVNNATTISAIDKALEAYIGNIYPKGSPQYNNILAALTQEPFYAMVTDKDGNPVLGEDGKPKYEMQEPHKGFKRLGADIFALDFKGHITISIWMYESKGGFVFRKQVEEEPFVADDEFYFTVINAKTAPKTVKNEKTGEYEVVYQKPLTGTYKAYPQFVYKDDGTVRDPLDSDAWLVTFDAGGKIESLQKNGATLQETITNEKGEQETVNVTYFTLKDGDGIRLYVPNGQYTVVELGSKSGGSYQAHAEYKASDGSDAPGSWEIQQGDVWLEGDTRVTNTGASQVYVTVDFEIGEHNVVQILTFYNQTTSLSLEKTLDMMEENKKESAMLSILETYKELTFTLKVILQLPKINLGHDDGIDTREPLVGYEQYQDEEKTIPVESSKYYYFTANRYTGRFEEDNTSSGDHKVEYEIVEHIEIKFVQTDKDKNQWTAEVPIKAGERIAVVMTADYNSINYWVDELDNEIPEAGQEFNRIIEGWVYAKLETVYDPLSKENITRYKYTYYKTLEKAREASTKSVPEYLAPIDDSAQTDSEYIQPATLAKMDLTPLIAPKEGSAQKGKKDVVSVVNWLGELPGYGYLKLTAAAKDEHGNTLAVNDVFIFKIVSSRTVLYVTLKPGETAYIYLQAGLYTVEEVNWGWRYHNPGGIVTDPTKKPEEGAGSNHTRSPKLTITISQENNTRKKAIQVDYLFTPNYSGWLGGEAGKSSTFAAATDQESGNSSGKD